MPLYRAIVAAARRPQLYVGFGVPDTLDGRFDLLVVHLVSVMRRLRGADRGELAQALVDVFITDMDRSLRELGVGDVTVPKRVKKMAEACYGRLAAYVPCIDAGDIEGLSLAIGRNVFPDGGGDARALAALMLADAAGLAAQPIDDIAAGRVVFAAVPVAETQP